MTDPSQNRSDPEAEPANLRFLRLLVTGLTAVMIAGLLVLIVLFVTRFPNPAPRLPETVQLPTGVTAKAVTFGTGWYAIVTEDNRLMIFDAGSGDLQQTVEIEGQ